MEINFPLVGGSICKWKPVNRAYGIKAMLSHLIKSTFLELLRCAKPRLVQVKDGPEPAATSEQNLGTQSFEGRHSAFSSDSGRQLSVLKRNCECCVRITLAS